MPAPHVRNALTPTRNAQDRRSVLLPEHRCDKIHVPATVQSHKLSYPHIGGNPRGVNPGGRSVPRNPTVAHDQHRLPVPDPPSRTGLNDLTSPKKTAPYGRATRARESRHNITVGEVALSIDSSYQTIRSPEKPPDTLSQKGLVGLLQISEAHPAL